MWECESWGRYKKTTNIRHHVRETIPHRRSLTEYQLLKRNAKMSDYAQCDKEVPEKSEEALLNSLQSSGTC